MAGSLACPLCGATLDSSVRYCEGCGRSISPEDLGRIGLKLGKHAESSEVGASSTRNYALSRRDHSGIRNARSQMWTMSMVLLILIGYYATMKYVLHEHLPGNMDIKLERAIKGQPVDWNNWKTPVGINSLR